MDSCEPVVRTPSFRRNQGRLFARKKSSITADDDEFEILARSAPVPRPPPTLLSPKLGVSFQLRSSTYDTMVVTDDAPSPRMLPFLRGPSTPGSTRSVLSPAGSFRAATPFVPSAGGRTPRRPMDASGSGGSSPVGRDHQGLPVGTGGSPRAVLINGTMFPAPRGCMGGEEEKKDDDGPSLSKRTRIEVRAHTL
jgi:hypothetical protein